MKICPRCGSKNVDWIIPQNWSIWECKDCDYTGPIIEGDEKLSKEIRENYELKLKIEKSKSEKDTNKKKSKKNKEITDEDEIEEDLTDEEIEKRLDELEM
ncbi:hypothetical protein SDC9_29465 [bioreactor metagenome]|uniref:Uncharacterized protein n=1 Tax=bioreactor metagenome TaxID=1076179 RepID=A0A644UWW1_9ZZZZ|nr:hypothetical protein [Methanobrevibacter sp.]MEA4957856.1 hypothetical protein [Methanobrevibacter sp.]